MTRVLREPVLSFSQPEHVDALLDVRGEHGGEAMLLAGGTDIGVQLRRHVISPRHLISIGNVPEFRDLTVADTSVHIGAAVTHRNIEDCASLPGSLTALKEACATVGSVQTRNVGTLVGNLCNASPAADTLPVLLTFDGIVRVASRRGRRELLVGEFLAGYRTTVIADDEVVTAIQLPVARKATGSAFVKLGRRRAMEISIACVAARVVLDDDGLISDASIALGSVGPTTILAADAAAVLVGNEPTRERMRAAAVAAADVARPVDDHRASAAYRQSMVRVLTERCLRTAVNRAGHGRTAA